MKTTLIDRFKDLFAELTGKNRFGNPDFVLLKTMMMLAAMDGEIADDEVDRFKELAATCRGYNGESFETLWDAALRSAGYLLIQSHFLGHDELVAAFVAEAEKDFIGEVVQETAEERIRAFDFLDQIAMADGDYSEIERDAIVALVKKVRSVREKALAERYPQGAKFDQKRP